MACAASPPSTVRSVTQGSRLNGLTAHPYHGLKPRPRPKNPVAEPEECTKSPWLCRASLSSHIHGTIAFETRDGQALDEALSQQSCFIGSPWALRQPHGCLRIPSPDVDSDHDFLAEDKTPKAKGCRRRGSSQLSRSCDDGIAPSFPSLQVLHTGASRVTRTLQQKSATRGRAPSSHFVTSHGVPSVQMDTGAPELPGVSGSPCPSEPWLLTCPGAIPMGWWLLQ